MKTHVAVIILVSFLITGIIGPMPVYGQDYHLPAPGVMIHLSPSFNPPILKGIKVHPDNPFRFDFIMDVGDGSKPSQNGRVMNPPLREESTKLIKYFLASLTIPEKDLWVNLSPYEKDRIIPQSFGLTEMGRDLLAEDYMLKQITASLIYPEDEIGKKFWKRIYEEAQKKFGTTNIPVNTFNKVWIVPEKAVVYENAKVGAAYVVESKLKVMLEQDYLSLEKHEGIQSVQAHAKDSNQLGSQIVREIVIPELTIEVNENKNFAHLRQVYNSLILATWYKKKIKDSILEQVYANKNKVMGVNINDPKEKERIYQKYLRAFKKGVFNYIKEDIDPMTQDTIPRKYFSGGFALQNITPAMTSATISQAMAAVQKDESSGREVQVASYISGVNEREPPKVQRTWISKIIRSRVPVGHPFVRVTNEGLFHGQKPFEKDARINVQLAQRLRQGGIDILVGDGLNDKNFINGLIQYQGSDLYDFLRERNVAAISIPKNILMSQGNNEEAQRVFKPILDPLAKEDPQLAHDILPLFIDFVSKMLKETDIFGHTSIDDFERNLHVECDALTEKQKNYGLTGKALIPPYLLLTFIDRWNYVANVFLKDVGNDRQDLEPLIKAYRIEEIRFQGAHRAEYLLNKLLMDWHNFGQKRNIKVFIQLGAWQKNEKLWESFLEISNKMKRQEDVLFNGRRYKIEGMDIRETDPTNGGGAGKNPIFEMTLIDEQGKKQRVLVKWMKTKSISYDTIGSEVAGILNVPTYHIARFKTVSSDHADEAWIMIEYRESKLIAYQSKEAFLTPGLENLLSGRAEDVKDRMRSFGASVAISDILDSRDALMKHFLLTPEGFIRIDQEYMFGDVPKDIRDVAVSWDKGDVKKFLKIIAQRQGGEDYIGAFVQGFNDTLNKASQQKEDILNIVRKNISSEGFDTAENIISQRLKVENRLDTNRLINNLAMSIPIRVVDQAMKSSLKKAFAIGVKYNTNVRGGIDLTPANMNIQVKTGFGADRGGIKFHLTPALLAQLQNALGFVPVIISIQPMTDIRGFLGLKE